MSIEVEQTHGGGATLAIRRRMGHAHICEVCDQERNPIVEIEAETSGGEYGPKYFMVCLRCIVLECLG